MQKLTEKLGAWTSLALILFFATGCTYPKPIVLHTPPIYLMESDIMCMSREAKTQIASHNCKVDYDPKICKQKEKINVR